MLIDDLSVGQVVKSKSGRDKDKVFFILKIIDKEYALISDGDLRKLDKPKLKKIRHLAKYNIVSEEIKNKILDNQYINDAFLRSELKRLNVKF